MQYAGKQTHRHRCKYRKRGLYTLINIQTFYNLQFKLQTPAQVSQNLETYKRIYFQSQKMIINYKTKNENNQYIIYVHMIFQIQFQFKNKPFSYIFYQIEYHCKTIVQIIICINNTFCFVLVYLYIIQMPLTSAKAKVLAISFQNKYGAKYYSNYYLKHSTLDLSKTQYDIKTEQGQQKLQKSLFQKIKKMNVASGMTPDKTDIFSFGGFTCLFKVINQLIILLICEQDENYVLMESVINCIGNTLLLITKDEYNQKTVQENLDSIVITVDQVLDEGIIMCLDQNVVYDRLKMRQGGAEKTPVSNTKPQQNNSGGAFSSIFGFAKNSLSKTLNFG